MLDHPRVPLLYTCQIRRWTAPGESTLVPTRARPQLRADDTVGAVRQAIQRSLPPDQVGRGGVCMWTEIAPTRAMLAATVDRLPAERIAALLLRPLEIRAMVDALFANVGASADDALKDKLKGKDEERGGGEPPQSAERLLGTLTAWCEANPEVRLVVQLGDGFVDPATKAMAVLDGANPFRSGIKPTTDAHLMERADSMHYLYSSDRDSVLLEDVVPADGALHFATFADVDKAF